VLGIRLMNNQCYIILNNILNFVQPLTIAVFLISGILSLIVGKSHQGMINICFSIANFMIFYGHRFLK